MLGELLSDVGPCRRALCARRDIIICIQLCKDKVWEDSQKFGSCLGGDGRFVDRYRLMQEGIVCLERQNEGWNFDTLC